MTEREISGSNVNLPGPLVVLDIGGTKIAGGIALASPACEAESSQQTHRMNQLTPLPAHPKIILERSTPTRAQRGSQHVLETVLNLATELIDTYQETCGDTPRGIGIASAGVVDENTGTIISATELIPGWASTKLGTFVAEATNLPCWVLNDVHAHALGEVTWGAAQEYESAVVLGVGTGIGGAVVTEGRVWSGAHSLAGHLGHMHHPLGEGFLCSCGREGHIEPVASGSGVATLYHRRLKAHHNESVDGVLEKATATYSGLDVQRLAEEGDEIALGAIADSACALGEVMGSLANTFDPEVFVLSGSMTKAGHMWWEPLRRGYASQAMNLVQNIPILHGTLGGQAPLLGAAANFWYRSEA